MGNKLRTPVRIIEIPPLSAVKRFGKYKDESHEEVRSGIIAKNKALETIMARWERFREFSKNTKFEVFWEDPGFVYGLLLESMHPKSYKPSDINSFGVLAMQEALSVHRDERDVFFTKIGLFMSALIERGRHKGFTMHLEHFEGRLDSLGYSNTKDLEISGDMGSNFCKRMKGGKVKLHGDALGEAGDEMSGGSLEIYGDAKRDLGKYLSGGRITVHGNVVGDEALVGYGMEDGVLIITGDVQMAGNQMRGGEIHIGGELVRDIASEGIVHGKIYHKGKLVLDK